MTTVSNLRTQLQNYLNTERNDGNKTYHIQSFHSVDEVLEHEVALAHGDDVFVSVQVTVDAQKHVKPLSVVEATSNQNDILKYKTLTKYTYYESGKDYLKVDLSELAGITTADNINVDFQNRSLTVKISGFKGDNF